MKFFLLFISLGLLSSLIFAPIVVRAQPTITLCSNVTWITPVSSFITSSVTWVSSTFDTVVVSPVISPTITNTPTVITPILYVPTVFVRSYVTFSTTQTTNINLFASVTAIETSIIETLMVTGGYVSVCAEWVATVGVTSASTVVSGLMAAKQKKNGGPKSGKVDSAVHDFEDEPVDLAAFGENGIEDVAIAAVTSFPGAVCAVSAVVSTCLETIALPLGLGGLCLLTTAVVADASILTIQTVSAF